MAALGASLRSLSHQKYALPFKMTEWADEFGGDVLVPVRPKGSASRFWRLCANDAPVIDSTTRPSTANPALL
jgi:hypothetical protein